MKYLFLIAGSIFYFFNQNNNFLGSEDSLLSENVVESNINSWQSDTEDIISEDEVSENHEYSDYGEYNTDEDNEYDYIPDDNPETWDEDPDNYPLETPDTYINVDGDEVQSPTQYNDIPEGACAICADGTYSFSRNRRGTCSHHGGVVEWLR